MTTKADQQAAERVLKAAVRRAVVMLRAEDANEDAVVALLMAAETSAAVLLDEAS